MKNFIVPIILLVVASCAERNIATTSESEMSNKDILALASLDPQLDSSWLVGDSVKIKLDSLKRPSEEELRAYARVRMKEIRERMFQSAMIVKDKSPGRTYEERKLLIDSVYTAFGLSDIVEKRNKRRKKIENDSLRAVD